MRKNETPGLIALLARSMPYWRTRDQAFNVTRLLEIDVKAMLTVKAKKLLVRAASAIAAGAIVAQPVAAEPGPVAAYLMETPVDLMSFGLMRLEMDARFNSDFHEQNIDLSASYVWAKDRIVIWLRDSAPKPERQTLEQAEARCRDMIGSVRLWLTFPRLGGIHFFQGSSPMEFYFSPIGHKGANELAELGEKIEQITEISAGTRFGSEPSASVDCTGSLAGDEVWFSK